MRAHRRVLVACAVLIAALAALAGAAPGLATPTRTRTQTATAPLAGGSSVSATVTYTPKSAYDAGLHLTITRAGQALYSARVTSAQCGTTCSVAGTHALFVTDIEQDGEPVVGLDLYTGGAHCCSTTQFFTYDPGTQTYREYEYDWGDPGDRLERLGGADVFVTRDDRFAYEFTDYAASGMPVQLLSFNGIRMVNVTARYPKLIARDAASYLSAYRSQAKDGYPDSVGIIAAWAADEDELGHRARVAAYLEAQAAAGHLHSGIPEMAGGARFITNLDAFLARTGYLA